VQRRAHIRSIDFFNLLVAVTGVVVAALAALFLLRQQQTMKEQQRTMKGQLDEMQRMNLAQRRPWLFVKDDTIQFSKDDIFHFKALVENNGNTVALGVSIRANLIQVEKEFNYMQEINPQDVECGARTAEGKKFETVSIPPKRTSLVQIEPDYLQYVPPPPRGEPRFSYLGACIQYKWPFDKKRTFDTKFISDVDIIYKNTGALCCGPQGPKDQSLTEAEKNRWYRPKGQVQYIEAN
jgi:hypothetical protein